jgi:hypothetical protein
VYSDNSPSPPTSAVRHANSPADVAPTEGDTSPFSISSPHQQPHFTPNIQPEAEPADDEDEVLISKLSENFKSMHMTDRFFGKSSGVQFMKEAMDLKLEQLRANGKAMPKRPIWPDKSERVEIFHKQPVSIENSMLFAQPWRYWC